MLANGVSAESRGELIIQVLFVVLSIRRGVSRLGSAGPAPRRTAGSGWPPLWSGRTRWFLHDLWEVPKDASMPGPLSRRGGLALTQGSVRRNNMGAAVDSAQTTDTDLLQLPFKLLERPHFVTSHPGCRAHSCNSSLGRRRPQGGRPLPFLPPM